MSLDKYEAIKELKSWINALSNEMNSIHDEFVSTLKGEVDTSSISPSKESAAELIFRGVGKKLDEVNYLYKEVSDKIFDK